MGDVLWNHEVGDDVLASGKPSKTSSSGVENCYVFKSRLQEYAQKVGISTPVYDTVKEGPSHEPVFKSTVIVNDVKYESLPGFFNRKVAEQSAAEIALIEIFKAGEKQENIPILHETGLCKNMLQEYSQKMNYAIPSYKCNKQPEGWNPYICTVEIGGIQYIGAAAKTKKEAEIKAARTALIALQYGSETSTNGVSSHSQYTVLPGTRKPKEQEPRPTENLKPKKARLKKKWPKRKFPRKNKDDNAANPNNDEALDHAAAAGGEDGSNAVIKDENEHHQQGQTDELKPTVMDTNGCYEVDQQDIFTASKAKIFDLPEEGITIDSAFYQEMQSGDIEIS